MNSRLPLSVALSVVSRGAQGQAQTYKNPLATIDQLLLTPTIHRANPVAVF